MMDKNKSEMHGKNSELVVPGLQATYTGPSSSLHVSSGEPVRLQPVNSAELAQLAMVCLKRPAQDMQSRACTWYTATVSFAFIHRTVTQLRQKTQGYWPNLFYRNKTSETIKF